MRYENNNRAAKGIILGTVLSVIFWLLVIWWWA